MRVILQQDVKNMGKKGAVIEVAEGYARNYLFPRKLAVEATAGQLKEVEMKNAAEARKQQQIEDEARQLAEKLQELNVKVTTKTGEGGRLFGSITNKDISEVLAKKHNLNIDKKKLELKDTIKSLGSYQVQVKLHPKVHTTLMVQVVEE
ncbi:MAG TPA: 50S ribosomal protein L9 [Bacillota bacterium]|nr:50S ribosomal protein L9 [Bacillota bacterium]